MKAPNSAVNSPAQWHRITRWLHALIALGIIAQLFSSQFMIGPDHLDKATESQKFFLETHEIIGLMTASVMLAHWLWIFFSADVSFSKLFPWNSAGLTKIGADIKFLLNKHDLPAAEKSNGLSGFIHGLGFLVASAMAASGFALFLVMDWGDGAGSESFERFAGIHEFFANFMWAYLIGHVLAAAWHEFRGQRIIAAIFKP